MQKRATTTRPTGTLTDDGTLWAAIVEKDETKTGTFVLAVLTTGIYCRPGCPARSPKRENVVFYDTPAAAEQDGFRACLRCKPKDERTPAAQMVESACQYLTDHLDRAVTLDELGEAVGISPHHLQRTFKRVTGVSPRAWADARRLEALKSGLKERGDVTTAMYDAGYGSSSRLYERAASQLGMTPGTYQKGGKGMNIGYTIADSRLGRLLVAGTERGISATYVGDTDEELEQALHKEYPAATIERDDARLQPWVAAILQQIEGQQPRIDLPLDVQGTAFQRRVWEALRTIPSGSTRSYAQVAAQLGQPKAVRAVAQACASNPAAIVTPCHRVVRSDGSLSGYRWGVERKEALLAAERGASS